jgi:hypothetical protein
MAQVRNPITTTAAVGRSFELIPSDGVPVPFLVEPAPVAPAETCVEAAGVVAGADIVFTVDLTAILDVLAAIGPAVACGLRITATVEANPDGLAFGTFLTVATLITAGGVASSVQMTTGVRDGPSLDDATVRSMGDSEEAAGNASGLQWAASITGPAELTLVHTGSADPQAGQCRICTGAAFAIVTPP